MSGFIIMDVGVFAASRRRSGGGTPTNIGRSTTGDTDRTLSSDRLWVSKATLASPGTLTELHGWFKYNSGTNPHVKLVIYADNGGTPAGGALKASTGALTITSASYTDINQTGFSVALTAGDYWIGHIDDNDTGSQSDQGSTGSVAFKTVAGQYATPPATFPASPSTGSVAACCWAVVLI